jgi:peroxiredoxin
MSDVALWPPGESATKKRGRRVLAWGLVVLVIAFGPPAVSQSVMSDLLGTLKLYSYPRGTKPPEFSGSTVEGQKVSLAGLQGRVVLLNFWATWCRECGPEMPVLEQLHRDFAAEGLTVLGINVREGKPTIQRYAKSLGLTFPLVVDPKGEIRVSYGVIGLPTTFMIGRDGRVVARAIGARDWGSAEARALIQALLAEPVARKGSG